MLGKRRTTYDTLASILQNLVNEPVTITDLFYNVATSYEALERALNSGIHFKLIEKKDSKYHITRKGLGFVDTWKNLQGFLKEE